MFELLQKRTSPQRRGAVAVLVMVTLVVLLGMASLTIDVGRMYRAKSELQTSADAAAMAAAWELLDEDRLKGGADMTQEFTAARTEAGTYAYANTVMNAAPSLALSDVVFGYLSDPSNPSEAISFATPAAFNTAVVYTRRTAQINGPITLLFSGVLGHSSTELGAMAAATFKDGAVGFRVTDETPNASVLPLTLRLSAWLDLLSGANTTGDGWSYDKNTDSVGVGSDQINEQNLYPGGGNGQLPAGDFGTIDIGASNNSTADLSRQIRDGLNAEDLAVYGGEFKLGADGTVPLNGDTGLSAALAGELAGIVGETRLIPLFSTVSGPGENATFIIVGFAGIRIMNVKLTGPMQKKRVIIQPAFHVDSTVITGPGSGSSFFVYKPVMLVR